MNSFKLSEEQIKELENSGKMEEWKKYGSKIGLRKKNDPYPEYQTVYYEGVNFQENVHTVIENGYKITYNVPSIIDGCPNDYYIFPVFKFLRNTESEERFMRFDIKREERFMQSVELSNWNVRKSKNRLPLNFLIKLKKNKKYELWKNKGSRIGVRAKNPYCVKEYNIYQGLKGKEFVQYVYSYFLPENIIREYYDIFPIFYKIEK